MFKATKVVFLLVLLGPAFSTGYPLVSYSGPAFLEQDDDSVYWGPSYRLLPVVDDNEYAVVNDFLDDVMKRSGGEMASSEDANVMEKRLYVPREGSRPLKRSMAIGRAGMRPGKRASARSIVGRGKRGQFPESYFPQNTLLSFDQ